MTFDFEKKIKPVFTFVGTICAVILAITYFVGAIVLINGLDKALGTQQLIMYAIYNGIMTFLIVFALGVQGNDFAKDKNSEIIKELNSLKPKKEKKIRSMTFYWCIEIPKKIVFKTGWAWFSTLAVTTIFVDGNGDMSLLLLVAMNAIMSFGTGLLFLTKTYDFYENNQVPLMKQKIDIMKGENNS